jgi:hypothetical protein
VPFRRIKTCRREPPGVGVAMPTAQDGARTSSVTTSWWVAARTGLPFIPTPSWKLKMPTAPVRRRPHTYGGLMPRGSDACGATRCQPEPHHVRSHPTRERRGTDGQPAAGASVASLARQDNVSWPTIMRVQDGGIGPRGAGLRGGTQTAVAARAGGTGRGCGLS